MATPALKVVPGQTIDEHEILEVIGDDGVFAWARARHLQTGSVILLQILVAGTDSDAVDKLFAYFDAVASVPSPELDKPCGCGAQRDTFTAEYDRDLWPIAVPDRAMWPLVCEALHALHTRGLTHGAVVPSALCLDEGDIRLSRLGYAPLLEAGNPAAIAALQGYLAPEVPATGPSPAADIYSLAKTLAKLHWEYASHPWTVRNTSPSPADRDQSARNARQGLEQMLAGGGDTGGITPHFTLCTTVEPPEGGTVTDGGDFELLVPPAQVSVKATPRPGWTFTGWSGDLTGYANPATVVMDQSRSITARFERPGVPKALCRLSVTADPPDAAAEVSESLHEQGSSVDVHLDLKPGWRLVRWSDPAYGQSASIRVTMERDVSLTAFCERAAARPGLLGKLRQYLLPLLVMVVLGVLLLRGGEPPQPDPCEQAGSKVVTASDRALGVEKHLDRIKEQFFQLEAKVRGGQPLTPAETILLDDLKDQMKNQMAACEAILPVVSTAVKDCPRLVDAWVLKLRMERYTGKYDLAKQTYQKAVMAVGHDRQLDEEYGQFLEDQRVK